MLPKIVLAAVGLLAFLMVVGYAAGKQSASEKALTASLERGGTEADHALGTILADPDAYSPGLLLNGVTVLRNAERIREAATLAEKALAKTLLKPAEQTPLVLYLCANEAGGAGRLEDSAFLFYAGQQRARFERECFPPKDSGGDDPFTALSAISSSLGQGINPAVMAQPRTFQAVMDRVKTFTPQVPPGYDPGYEYTKQKPTATALAATEAKRAEFVQMMSGMATLLNDPDYFKAFQTIQGYNFGTTDPRPSKADRDTAMATIRRIEQEHGLKLMGADETE